MYSNLKYEARDDIRGRFLADFCLLFSRFLLRGLFFFGLFCFLFALIKGGYPIYIPILFISVSLTAYALYLFLKVKSEIRFYFPAVRPVHLKRAGIGLYFKFLFTDIIVNALKILTLSAFLVYPAVILLVLFMRIKNGGVYYPTAVSLTVLSGLLILTGTYVSVLINLRFSAVNYYILKSRDSSVVLSIKKSRESMNDKLNKCMSVKTRNIKYIVLSLFILPAPYCIAMKNAVEHEAVLSYLSDKKEKAVTFIIDRPGKFSLG